MEVMDDASTVERMLMNQASEKRIPINGSIELLPLCNMNCDMCYVRLSREEMNRQGRLRTFEEWLEIGQQMQKAGVLFLLLTGGEPLLYPDFKKLYLALKKLGMILTVNTNGTLIDEEWAKFFGENKPRRINITLYGADKKAYEDLCHYPTGFDKVINAVKLLKANGVDVKLSSSITKANVADIERLNEIGTSLDVPVRCDTYMMPATRERNKPYNMQSRLDPITAARARVRALKVEMGADLFKQYVAKSMFEVDNILPDDGEHKMHCHAGKCSFTINWQGELRPCVIMTKPAVSVFEVGFEKAWQQVVTEIDKITLSSKCQTCNLRTLCRTCAASELLEEGSFQKAPQYMCDYAKETYRLLKEEFDHDQELSNR